MFARWLTHFFQFLQNIPEIFRQFCADHHRVSVPGVRKAQDPSVEALAGLTQLRFFVTVHRIAQNGVTDMSHVDPDLVGSAGFQPAADVGIPPEPLHHLPMGDGRPGIAGGDAHFLPISGVASDGGIHCAAILPERAADDSIVGAGHGVILQLRGQHCMGKVIFGNGQKTGGVFINAVNNARAKLAVDTGKLPGLGK